MAINSSWQEQGNEDRNPSVKHLLLVVLMQSY